jgi:hypothetical protein
LCKPLPPGLAHHRIIEIEHGRWAAPQRRTKLGRKPKSTEHQKREAIRRRDRDGEPVRRLPTARFAVDGVNKSFSLQR